ncbi:uncharacterized protein G2W53_033164 [Senna tora]|uniref:Uncharacterized protein n=1 Tax=Senna tora TaxID=362788 RepID=A0A834SYS1_9FABA|nr:uncharacterized protein G2W53_033164 [Senna tora]
MGRNEREKDKKFTESKLTSPPSHTAAATKTEKKHTRVSEEEKKRRTNLWAKCR